MASALVILPISLILLFVAKPLSRRMRSMFSKQTGLAAAGWTRRLVDRRPPRRKKLAALPYAKAAAGGQTECAVCLCAIEEGDEVPELRCRHVFHRACLDEWVDRGRETCPLCRLALVSSAAETDDDPIPDDVALPFSALFQCSLLRW